MGALVDPCAFAVCVASWPHRSEGARDRWPDRDAARATPRARSLRQTPSGRWGARVSRWGNPVGLLLRAAALRTGGQFEAKLRGELLDLSPGALRSLVELSERIPQGRRRPLPLPARTRGFPPQRRPDSADDRLPPPSPGSRASPLPPMRPTMVYHRRPGHKGSPLRPLRPRTGSHPLPGHKGLPLRPAADLSPSSS